MDLGRKKFAKVFVMSYMGSRVLQEKLCHLKSTCIQAKQLQYNNDIHYVLMIFIFLHIRRFCISKGGSVPLPSDMRGSTVQANCKHVGQAVCPNMEGTKYGHTATKPHYQLLKIKSKGVDGEVGLGTDYIALR